MLKNISWTEYTMTVSTIFFIYYLYIGIKYYSDEIKDFFSGKQKQNFMPAFDAKSMEQARDEHDSLENHSDNQFDKTEQLIERLKSVIADGTKRQLILQEFKQYLRMVLKEYPSVRYSPLRSSINGLIISECKKYGAAILNEDEVELLWKEGL
jgi:hypothetical protein